MRINKYKSMKSVFIKLSIICIFFVNYIPSTFAEEWPPLILSTVECIENGESTYVLTNVSSFALNPQEFSYSVDDESLATVSSTGLLTANSSGKTGMVTVTIKSNVVSDKTASTGIYIGNCEIHRSVHIEFEDVISSKVDYNDTVTLKITTHNLDEDDLAFILIAGDREKYHGTTVKEAASFKSFFADSHKEFYGFHTKEVSFVVDSKNDYVYYFVIAKEKNDGCYWEEGRVLSNIIKLKVIKPLTMEDNTVIPTVFTPMEVDGANDDFVPGYSVVIYNRVGDVICVSSNGWDGKYKGELADAGVYIYSITMKDGKVKKGTIQLYKE